MNPKEFTIFAQDFWKNDYKGMGRGHGNNTLPFFISIRNTKGFLLCALSLHLPPAGDLRPELSDRNFKLVYFFTSMGSINLIYLPFLLGVSLAILMDDIIVTNSLSNAVSNSFKASILSCNWRKKIIFLHTYVV